MDAGLAAPTDAVAPPLPAAADERDAPRARRTSAPGDPLSAVLRRAGVVRLLVLMLVSGDGDAPAYGSRLIERIREVSGGLVTVNPNTMYPLLRTLEEQGLVEGSWEHPVRRSRRFYRITAAGIAERERLRGEVLPALDDVAAAVGALRGELAG